MRCQSYDWKRTQNSQHTNFLPSIYFLCKLHVQIRVLWKLMFSLAARYVSFNTISTVWIFEAKQSRVDQTGKEQ
jgi:hypothetical protein